MNGLMNLSAQAGLSNAYGNAFNQNSLAGLMQSQSNAFAQLGLQQSGSYPMLSLVEVYGRAAALPTRQRLPPRHKEVSRLGFGGWRADCAARAAYPAGPDQPPSEAKA